MNEDAQRVVDAIKALNAIQDQYWLNHTLFSWQWWTGIFFSLAPWIIWIILRKKNQTDRLLFAGFFVIIVSSYLDFAGVELTLWYYEHKVLPTIPAYIPWDFSLLPVSIMLLLQYKPAVNPYLKAVFFGGFAAFAAEPFFEMLQLYSPIAWKSIYSFPIYFILYLISHFLSRRKYFEPL